MQHYAGLAGVELAEAWDPDAGRWLVKGVAGLAGLHSHGLFVSAQIVSRCDGVSIRRTEVTDLGTPVAVESALCRALADAYPLAPAGGLAHARAIIHCGFAGQPIWPGTGAAAGGGHMLGLAATISRILSAPGSDRVLVCPAGNVDPTDPTDPSDPTTPMWPAAHPHPNVIGVAAVDRHGTATWYTRRNAPGRRWVDCCTLGDAVEGPYVDASGTAGYARWGGTSFAAPRVAAELANRARLQPSVPIAVLALQLASAPPASHALGPWLKIAPEHA